MKNISELTLKMSEKPFASKKLSPSANNESSEKFTLLSHMSRDNMCIFYLLARYVITETL